MKKELNIFRSDTKNKISEGKHPIKFVIFEGNDPIAIFFDEDQANRFVDAVIKVESES